MTEQRARPTSARGQRHRRVRALAAAALVPGAVTAVLDATGLGERRVRAMQLVPFGPLLGVPSAVVAVVSALAGWPALAGAASVLAARQLTLDPRTPARRRNRMALGAAGATGRAVRVATVNLGRDERAARAAADLAVRDRVDVLVVEELVPAATPAFAGADLVARFPHRFEAPDDGFFGSAVYSRFPLVTPEDRPFGGRHTVVATIDVGRRAMTLVVVHLQAPIHRRDEEPWRSGFADLADVVRAASGPVVLAGDWNATTGNRPFRRLLRDHDLIDAHLAGGRAWARTWPAVRHVPPLLLLDHVVVGRGAAVRSVSERRVDGSDHLAVVADVVVP